MFLLLSLLFLFANRREEKKIKAVLVPLFLKESGHETPQSLPHTYEAFEQTCYACLLPQIPVKVKNRK